MDKAENPRAFSIELDGKRLTPDEIQTIAHSEPTRIGCCHSMKGSLDVTSTRPSLRGLKLYLKPLSQDGFVRRGANIRSRDTRWHHSYLREIATG